MRVMPTAKERFATLISEVAREVTRRRSSDACCGDLTLEQFETLRAVATSDTSTIGSLSAALHVELSTMSRNVSVLERNGYLQRARGADDGRVVVVRLTPKGRDALSTLRCGERDVLGDVFERLSPAERAEATRALETLRSRFDDGDAASACCAPVPLRRRRA